MSDQNLPYLAYDAPETRAPLELPEGVAWVTNLTGGELFYWASRNELAAHVWRKRYARERYDPATIVLGEPQPTEVYSTDELIAHGVIGIYGQRIGGGA